jgi:serine/threonine-protein kinase
MTTPSDGNGVAATEGAEASRPAPANASRVEPKKSDRPSMRPGGPESLVGTIIGARYLIERVLGEGGMGAVYQAQHTHMRKRLAVKVLHPEMSRMPEVVARFEREAMAAAHIEHPNVAAATDFGKLDDGSFFLVLEYVEGKSLRDAQAKTPMELGRALHIVRQIAGALGRAHSLGIVHRDLKPENVMLVAREGDPDFVKVLDFGIAKVPVGELGGETKAPGTVLTQLGMVYGTPEYMAPEQALGQPVDARADLYALGVMAFELITGARPFDHESKVTLLGMHVTAPIPKMRDRAPAANVPAEIDAIVEKLLAKEATARFADAKELTVALDTVSSLLAARGRIADMPIPPSLVGPTRGGALRASAASVSDANEPSVLSAVGPTSLAEPSVSRPGQASLASLVGASLGGVLKSAPSWMTPRLAIVLASAVAGLVLAVGIVVSATSGPGPQPGPASSASAGALAPAPPPRPADPKVDEVVAAAQAKIEKGDFASAIDELAPIEKKDPDRADVHALLERAYTSTRNAREAMREAGLWLAADANAAADLRLEEDVRNAALLRDAQDDAFVLLQAKMGMRGIDLLYDIAYGASGRLYPQAATRAKKALEVDEVRQRASPALGVVLAFRETRTCDQKHALLGDARDKGDVRMLTLLQPYEASRGCGFLGRTDCYPCMRRDHDLLDAIQAIQDRATK